MTRHKDGLRLAGWAMTGVGVCGLLVALYLALAPGLHLAPLTPFGSSVTLDLPAGDHALYIRPSGDWGSVVCTDGQTDAEVRLRPDMIQQDLYLPQRWYAQGTFEVSAAGPVVLTCDGKASSGQFTVGPDVSALDLAGVFLVAVTSLVLVLAGQVTPLLRRRSR